MKFSQVPVQADDNVTCDDASITKLQDDVGKLTDEGMKAAAMKEIEMAKTLMGEMKVEECVTHMTEARKQMTKTQ